ncbi:MAG: hypothetical protein GEV12_13630 [Micromonosporaceae bacterium]|nr:hypothetical protein [Micromonosporaceae bacterium]
MTTIPEFDHARLTRAELGQAAKIATAVSVRTRGNLAESWRRLATALHQLAEQRDPQHGTLPVASTERTRP